MVVGGGGGLVSEDFAEATSKEMRNLKYLSVLSAAEKKYDRVDTKIL